MAKSKQPKTDQAAEAIERERKVQALAEAVLPQLIDRNYWNRGYQTSVFIAPAFVLAEEFVRQAEQRLEVIEQQGGGK